MSATSVRDADAVQAQLAASSRFLIQQVFRPIGNEYRVSVPAEGSVEEGEALLYVKQKRLAVREDIRFRLGPDTDSYLFMIKARTMFEFAGRHDVNDAAGNQIGLISKDFMKSILRSHWVVKDASGNVLFEAHEASWPIAIVRRVADLIPYGIGAVLSFLPFNFTFVRDGQQIGTYKRVLGKLRDRYVMELGPELDAADRRLVVAFAVALDALQDR
jgi:uncharacterized protein YxjI